MWSICRAEGVGKVHTGARHGYTVYRLGECGGDTVFSNFIYILAAMDVTNRTHLFVYQVTLVGWAEKYEKSWNFW